MGILNKGWGLKILSWNTLKWNRKVSNRCSLERRSWGEGTNRATKRGPISEALGVVT